VQALGDLGPGEVIRAAHEQRAHEVSIVNSPTLTVAVADAFVTTAEEQH
jgi:hypothetical protein